MILWVDAHTELVDKCPNVKVNRNSFVYNIEWSTAGTAIDGNFNTK